MYLYLQLTSHQFWTSWIHVQMKEYIWYVTWKSHCLHCLKHQMRSTHKPSNWSVNCLKLQPSPNLLQGFVYILPLYHSGNLFIRYIASGSYKSAVPKLIEQIKKETRVRDDKIYLWELYTSKDFQLQSKTSAKGECRNPVQQVNWLFRLHQNEQEKCSRINKQYENRTGQNPHNSLHS